MLSKNQIKDIVALHHKKFRYEENVFIAEGIKVVVELLSSGMDVIAIYGTQEFYQKLNKSVIISKQTEVVLIEEKELRKISALSTPQHVLAVARMKDQVGIDFEKGLKLVLDNISDPGNLGTLIRIADWFGIEEIICTNETVDCYNPKVVQSSMGSLFRLKITYSDLKLIFDKNLTEKKLPVYGTVLDGKNIYDEDLSQNSFVIIGNESSGISENNFKYITKKISIPSAKNSRAESLNAAVAAGIICAQFRRTEN